MFAWVIVLAPCVLGYFFTRSLDDRDSNQQMATLMATDDRIAEFGDGGHAIPITPEAAYSIGQTAAVGDYQVTVTDISVVEDTSNIRSAGDVRQYVRIRFNLKNVAKEDRSPNLFTSTQIQYPFSGNWEYRWENMHDGECLPSLKGGVQPIAPGSAYECSFIYEVPRGGIQYWVFSDGTDENTAVFRVR